MLALQQKLWANNAEQLTKSLLSCAGLLSQFGRFADAGKLLLEGYQRLPSGLLAGLKLKRDALKRLVRLYEKWNEQEPDQRRAEKAAEWRQQLTDFDKSTPNTKTGDTQP